MAYDCSGNANDASYVSTVTTYDSNSATAGSLTLAALNRSMTYPGYFSADVTPFFNPGFVQLPVRLLPLPALYSCRLLPLPAFFCRPLLYPLLCGAVLCPECAI